MLIGLFLRHYKIYKNINFVPISSGQGLTAYLGANGAGKSSILDALDKFFNYGDWSINVQAKSEGGISSDDKIPYIVPVFSIIKSELSGANADTAEIISSYFWNTKLKTSADALNVFYSLREKLPTQGISQETHYLLVMGRQHNKNNAYLGSFHNDPELRNALTIADKDDKDLDKLLSAVHSQYAYFYIPVEADPSHFSKLESTHVQKLLDEDIRKKIETAIGPATVSSINTSLSAFIDEISASLEDYKYKGTFKDRLTMNDLVDKIFEAYFSIKILHRSSGNQVPIRDMSAGEKRKALLDLSYSLLRRNEKRSHKVILAVDEPDASLHTSACHDHFARLATIPTLTVPACQVLLTTHWYGFLPIVQKGIAHSISNLKEKIEFFTFDLYNFREQIRHAVKESKGELPRDVELKSYNDLLQSIVSSVVRPSPYNWLLCEGLSDKIYLEYYLSDLISSHNLRIVPLGGFKEVRRAYEYLLAPLGDKEYQVNGKILCLVDTDSRMEKFSANPAVHSISFKRLIFDESVGDAVLVKIDDQLVSPSTEIEHALFANRFLKTVSMLDEDAASDKLKDIVSKADTDEDNTTVYGYLNLTPTANRSMMQDYFDVEDNKVTFAKAYIDVEAEVGTSPKWVEMIKDFFAPQKKIK